MKTKKRIFKLISILTLVLFTVGACKSDAEEIIIDEAPTAINGVKVIKYGYYGKDGKSSSGTSIAVFDNQNAYDNTVSNLEAQVDAWDDQFVAQGSFRRRISQFERGGVEF